MHIRNIVKTGVPIEEAKNVLVMLHGRGASADDILGLAEHFDIHNKGFALWAPQATNHTWYPTSFMQPIAQNEPWLSSALSWLKEIVDEIVAAGIPYKHIYFSGFSQGACLSLEFVARFANNYGGVAAFTGGLIGPEINLDNYQGSFDGAPVFIGTSDPDFHVPVERVEATAKVLESMGASVTTKIYKNMGHTIVQDEIDHVNRLIFNK
ncbi:phospholipase/carboxylesterase [Chitinophaga skermanii]|uniref:Phospholipase/carboxylesterase n=1 Tax=Chitinophaga skermanii TaxID=331697 RepID=A0A327R5B1_9BACT|nr:dienelactone hydrolase family protein [Chitinophaga skermanii]RAJ10884.1 phospholipase/carboxylesterase [Chitinophaga skermanii]